jgi:uncharacterized membrane protein
MAERPPAVAEITAEDRAEPALPGLHPMEIKISYVLRFGVLLAGAIVLIGIVLFVVQGTRPGRPTSLNTLAGSNATTVAASPRTIADGVLAGDPVAIIQIGVLALILTPIVRVAMTVAFFAAVRDRSFVLFTAAVLTILVVALIAPL